MIDIYGIYKIYTDKIKSMIDSGYSIVHTSGTTENSPLTDMDIRLRKNDDIISIVLHASFDIDACTHIMIISTLDAKDYTIEKTLFFNNGDIDNPKFYTEKEIKGGV